MTKRKIEYKSITDLVPYARNTRKHSDRQVDQIAASIRSFGFNCPILIDDQGTIRSGHGRYLAAQKLGLEQVPTIKLEGLTDAQIRAFAIVDNQTTLLSSWDDELLALEIEEIEFDAGEFDLSISDIPDLTEEPNEKELDEGIETKNACPSCGYKW